MLDKAKGQWSNMVGKLGIGKVIGCGCLGCLLPIGGVVLVVLVGGWWLLFSGGGEPTAPAYAPRYATGYAPANGQRVSAAPTPSYAPSITPGATRNAALPSMMGNQPGYLAEGAAAYLPYTGGPSLAEQAGYLGWANATGQRRTPYVKGQTLSNGMTVVTADFDFVLLQDSSGLQWFCDPSAVNCMEWR